MKLIADSGSTKTEWHLVIDGQTVETFASSGINPFYQTTDEIADSLHSEMPISKLYGLESISFYGAGCANEDKNKVVSLALERVFQTSAVFIGSDLLGAARALCQHQAGIACILGTGSNSCFYDGQQIANNISPLGFILGDEGSGALMGKKLVADILKKQLPEELIQAFFSSYAITPAEIVHAVYRQAFPNRFLAQFTHFLAQHIAHASIDALVVNSFHEFISRNILQYPEARNLPIHFTGSIAFHFSAQLQTALQQFDLQLATLVRNPINQLVKFHAAQ